MAAKLIVCTGPAGSGKTCFLLEKHREALRGSLPGGALWLAPTGRYALDIRSRLLGGSTRGYFHPGVMTFDRFADSILRFAQTPIRSISGSLRRQLLRAIVDQGLAERRLAYFAAIAQTNGFLDELEALIAELKRQEIWPDAFSRAFAGGGSPRQRELAWIYERYQLLLNEHHLYDAEGRFWTARALMRGGQRRPFERLKHVIADGFTDFTTTQHEILAILAQWVDEIFISLPLEEQTARQTLFKKTTATLSRLRRQSPGLHVRQFERRNDAPLDLIHLEREIFKLPDSVCKQPASARITLVRAASQQREMEFVARRIKALLIFGDAAHPGAPVTADDVIVVFRSVSSVEPLVREVFSEFGIPVSIEQGRPLARVGALVALVSLLRLDDEDWPYRQVLSAIANNYYRSAASWLRQERLAAADRLVHALQIPRGRDELLKCVARWAMSPDGDPDDDENHLGRRRQRRRRVHDARLALPLLEELAAHLDSLPRSAAPGDWAEALEQFAERMGLLDAIQSDPDDQDRRAWRQLLLMLRQHDWLQDELGESRRLFSRRELLDWLTDVLHHETLPPTLPEAGHVRILGAAGVRNARASYVFFAGLTEDSFPRHRAEPLLHESDIADLQGQGVRFQSSREREDEEMLLFYEVVTRAERGLWLSYAALDDAAQEVLPSPYLAEIEQLFDHLTEIDLTDPRPLATVNDEPLSPAEARIAAVAMSTEQSAPLLIGYATHAGQRCDQLLAGLMVTQQRARPEFGPYEGLLASTRANQFLAERFGPRRLWSASLLEQYATCPFRFFLEQVLRVQPLEEIAVELDPAQRGLWLHQALAALHRRINATRQAPTSPTALDVELVQQFFREALAELPSDEDSPLAAALNEIIRRTLYRWSEDYYRQHEKYENAQRGLSFRPLPTHFEVPFGMPACDADDSEGFEPLALVQDGEEIRIWGRIDRIDLGRHGERELFNVIDYKSGRVVRKNVDDPIDGTALQLELYTLAAQQVVLGGQALPVGGGYWSIQENGFKQILSMCDLSGQEPQLYPGWERRRDEVTKRVFELVQGVRRGEFPVFSRDDTCTGYCPYRTVCRVNQVRSLEKAWPPSTVGTS